MYEANSSRYDSAVFRRCGTSGIVLPAVSLGLWHNFGGVDTRENAKKMLFTAFDLGITHFDLANNYGPPPGSAEETFGGILKHELAAYRDELIISTKAGFKMWDGPYQNGGSRKYLVSSLDAGLKRMGLEYVDIFYHHRPDPDTPLEETMGALASIASAGKALYVGISNYYEPEQARRAIRLLKDMGAPILIHQPAYNMFRRDVGQSGLLDVLRDEGVGCITFSPLSQGVLTDKYLNGIPEGSRASRQESFLKKDRITDEVLNKVRRLNDLAAARGQSLAQMALAWNLRHPEVTSVLIGASKPSQVTDSFNATRNLEFTTEELEKIDTILAG
jgi:L-glyceraldehyde 3-phosphate reductase